MYSNSCGLYLFLLVWSSLLYLSGIWLFSSGFLLHRMVVTKNSSCNSDSDDEHDIDDSKRTQTHWHAHTHGLPQSSQPGCWFPARYQQTIIILLDGLRYDFAHYNSSLSNSSLPDYLNKMPIFDHLVNQSANHSFLFKFQAHPPTTTLQRLKALTTGSLPTFIDMSWNFASYMIDEDNLVRQFKNDGKKVVFMGDDTWKGLYQKDSFHRAYYFPSFNVKDLHTVDDEIIKRIGKEIKSKDWDVIVAHFLGIDHCGHRYGPSHPEMGKKLAQMEIMLRDVISLIKNESSTILFVMGDHGMTSTGDHGGDSDNEINSALFVYSPKPVTPINVPQSVFQIDLVPTISLLMGVSIPFSNVGQVISSLFAYPLKCDSIIPNDEFRCHEDIPLIQSLWTSIAALRINVAQIQRYLAAYNEISDVLPNSIERELEELLERYDRQWVLLSNIPSDDKEKTVESLEKLRSHYENYLKKVRSHLELMWATFDMHLIISGLIVLFLSAFSNLIMLTKTTLKSQLKVICVKHLVGVLMGATIANLLNVGFPFVGHNRIGSSLLADVIFLGAVTSILLPLGTFIIPLYSRLHTLRYNWLKNKCFQFFFSQSSFALFTFLFHFACLFSNSFVVNENQVVFYLLQTLILSNIFYTFLFGKLKLHHKYFIINLILLITIRVSYLLHRCREEQQHSCQDSLFLIPFDSLGEENLTILKSNRIFLACSCVTFVIVSSYLIVRNHLIQHSVLQITVRYLFLLACLCLFGDWTLKIVNPKVLQVHLKDNQDILAKITSITSSILVGLYILFPSKLIKKDSNLTNVVILLTLAFIPLCLYEGDGPAIGLSMFYICVALYLTSINLTGISSDNYLINLIIWHLLSYHGFFTTGHQFSISSIPWHAAFIGNSGEFTTYLVPGFQVIMNIFACQFICGFSVCLFSNFNSNFKLKFSEFQYRENLGRIVLGYLFLNGIIMFGTCLSCAILRRHLMVWKIFAPRFIFQLVSWLVTTLSVIAGYIFCFRTNTQITLVK